MTVFDMIGEASRRFPDVPYLAGKEDAGWMPRTFREVERDSLRIGAALAGRGFRTEDTIAILSEGSPRWVIGEFGTLAAGCVSVPLSIKLLAEEIPFRLNHSESKAVLVSRNQLGKLLSVYGQLEGRPVLILLDDEPAAFGQAADEAGVPADRRVLFGDLLAEGTELLRLEPDRLETILASRTPDDTVTISYTSGTTGNPKGIMLSSRNYLANCRDAVEAFRVPSGYRTLLILPCDHSFGHTVGLYAALLRGITISFVDARGGAMSILRNIPGNLRETGPTFLLTVPALTGNFMKKIIGGISEKGGLIESLFRRGIEAGIRYHGDGFRKPPFRVRAAAFLPYHLADLLIFRKIRRTFGKRIRYFVGGGALLEPGQQQFFRALGIPVYQGYGLTEASPVISSNTPFRCRFGTSGTVLPSIDCRIVRPDGGEAAPGETGEIVIRGENVMKGYFRNEEATREAIRDGWLHTGDMGHFDGDGFLVVSGRVKALLISADGEKYSPEEIEEAIVSGSRLISQVLVYNDHRKYTTALVTLDVPAVEAEIRHRGILSTKALASLLGEEFARLRTGDRYRSRFPSQWIPSVFRILPEAFSEENRMINSTMKMVRYRIIERYADEIESMYAADRDADAENLQLLRELFPKLDRISKPDRTV